MFRLSRLSTLYTTQCTSGVYYNTGLKSKYTAERNVVFMGKSGKTYIYIYKTIIVQMVCIIIVII